MFTHTLSMTSSDANAITAVVTRDILPVMLPQRFKRGETSLVVARITAFLFITTTLIIALNASRFGGVLSLLVIWFGGLVGPISIPMLLGLLPWFKRSGSIAALISWAVGVGAFFTVKFVLTDASAAMTVAAPVLSSLIIYIAIGWLRPTPVRPEVEALLAALNTDAEAASAQGITTSQEA